MGTNTPLHPANNDAAAPVVLTEAEWSLIETALRVAREQWEYDRVSMANTGQMRLAWQFLRQYLDAGDLLTKLANRP